MQLLVSPSFISEDNGIFCWLMSSQDQPALGSCTGLYEQRQIIGLLPAIHAWIIGKEKKKKKNTYRQTRFI